LLRVSTGNDIPLSLEFTTLPTHSQNRFMRSRWIKRNPVMYGITSTTYSHLSEAWQLSRIAILQ
jgi:hypothetical protein